MIRDALDFLSKQAQESEAATLLTIPGDGRKAYVDQKGTVSVYDVSPPLRKHAVNSFDDMIAAADKWNNSPVVWINGSEIVLIPDDADRRDRVTLTLNKSAAFAKLIELQSKPVLEQQDLIRVLRIDLQGTINRAALLTA